MALPSNQVSKTWHFWLLLFATGCFSNKPPSLTGPPPGEANRKKLMDSSQHGAASIEGLIKAFNKARETKDLKYVRKCFVHNIGAVNPDGTYPWYVHTHKDEKLLLELFELPIRDVVLEDGTPPGAEIARISTYYIPNQNKQYSALGQVVGKLILLTEDDQRIDPCYTVSEHYGGRIVFGMGAVDITEDAIESYKAKREPRWKPLPIYPKTEEEKVFARKLLRDHNSYFIK